MFMFGVACFRLICYYLSTMVMSVLHIVAHHHHPIFDYQQSLRHKKQGGSVQERQSVVFL